MPTPFEPTLTEPIPKREWAARSEGAKRSVFGNFRVEEDFPLTPTLSPSERERENRSPSQVVSVTGGRPATTGSSEDEQPLFPRPRRGGEGQGEGERAAQVAATLQSSIDLALARAFIHRFLAKAYEDPTPDGWQWLCDARNQESLRVAWNVVQRRTGFAPVSNFSQFGASNEIQKDGDRRDACPTFSPGAFDSFHSAYLAAFGHAARGQCPLNEIEYGDLKADPLFQPHRLADLAAFYSAFGLELAGDADERQDHICLELEFLCVLAAKEAYALENQLDAEELALCRDAQKKFLREHLGRWTPAFARRLASTTPDLALRALAEFTRVFIESECARFAVNPGGEDLLLRPVDQAAESMCASCGIPGLPPGALPTT